MKGIGQNGGGLEDTQADFAVEALGKELRTEWIVEALQATGRDSIRLRLLPARFVIWFVILLGLHRRVSYANLLEKVVGSFWTQAHWPQECPPTTSALTKARDRLGVKPVKHLWQRSAREWVRGTPGLIFHGRRVCAIDGSTCKTADVSGNHRHFGRPGASRGRAAYPQMRVALLVDIGQRLILGERHGPYSDSEIQMARELLPQVEPGSLVLIDRNFVDYEFLWDLHARGADFLVRIPKKIKPRLVKRLSPGDAIVEVQIPRYYRKLRPDMPRTWTLRMISYCPAGGKETIRLFTTLVQETEIGKEEFAALYHERWGEETVIDELKTHLCGCQTVNQAVMFRSRTPARVEQEWYGLLLAFNAVRKTMSAAAQPAQVYPCRLSFTAAVERLREASYEMMRMPACRLMPRYQRLLLQIARAVIPERPGRKNPRAVKIKMSKFPLKRSRCAA